MLGIFSPNTELLAQSGKHHNNDVNRPVTEAKPFRDPTRLPSLALFKTLSDTVVIGRERTLAEAQLTLRYQVKLSVHPR